MTKTNETTTATTAAPAATEFKPAMTWNMSATSKFEDEVLNLIRDANEMTTSDLQGVVSALVRKIQINAVRTFQSVQK
jgi:hypothetical protein